jgi:uroporphyrin-III C-methyltransferase/precorrin-2 dehydrogenase/sirohydrochlorin ferrochelatase
VRYLPIFIDVSGRRCLVVGGGAVAARKVELLQAAGADVCLVAPEIGEGLRMLAARGGLQTSLRPYQAGDLDGVQIVVAATDSAEVNARVAREAQQRGIPVNVVDSPVLCTFIMPAVVDRSPVLVAISTAGTSPVLARLVRTRIETVLPAKLGRLADFAARHRASVRRHIVHATARRAFWEAALAGPIADLVLSEQDEQADRALHAALARGAAATLPVVALIAVGDGDPERQSLAAVRCLSGADLLLHEPDAARTVRALGRRDAERIEMPDAAGTAASRSESMRVMVDRAGRGQRVCVVRRGDPYAAGWQQVEEAKLLREAGLGFVVLRPAPA